MKKLLLILLPFLMIMSCDLGNNDPDPVSKPNFIGTWQSDHYFIDNDDPNLNFRFRITINEDSYVLLKRDYPSGDLLFAEKGTLTHTADNIIEITQTHYKNPGDSDYLELNEQVKAKYQWSLTDGSLDIKFVNDSGVKNWDTFTRILPSDAACLAKWESDYYYTLENGDYFFVAYIYEDWFYLENWNYTTYSLETVTSGPLEVLDDNKILLSEKNYKTPDMAEFASMPESQRNNYEFIWSVTDNVLSLKRIMTNGTIFDMDTWTKQ